MLTFNLTYRYLVIVLLAMFSIACSQRPVKQEIETSEQELVSTKGQLVDPNIPDPMKNIDLPLPLIKGYDEVASLLKAERANEAIERLQSLSQEHPTFSGVNYRLSRLYLAQKNHQEALISADKAIEINPNNYYALNLKGVISRELGEFQQAKQAYLDSIAIYSQFADAHLNLGILADIYLYDFQLALKEYQVYLTLVTEDKKVSGWLLDLQRRATQESP